MCFQLEVLIILYVLQWPNKISLTLNLRLTFGVHVLKEGIMCRPPTKAMDNVKATKIYFFDKFVGHQDVAVQPPTSQQDESNFGIDGILNKQTK
jgi:hypothetical protein